VKQQIPVWPVAVLALLIVAAVGYFVLVGPKRSEASRLADEIAELETKVQTAKLAAQPKEAATQLKVAGLFELTKAMPDKDDMPGIMLELNSVAEAAGIEFRSISPQPLVAYSGYRALPIGLTFRGNYFDLTDFLFRLRNLVAVRDGKLSASGRFFTLDSLDLHLQGDGGFPLIEAQLTISAYVYDPAAVSAAPVAPITGTTPATTTTAPDAAAAGGLP
jgi:Tfp pilus assembly protein PilO